ncbi:hypothetical protein [Lysobacter brunescens]|uniref:Uncharacterized protein n=1 Tax=Lysobacter brunescens TaxID=262323 RepID=A0ABW2YGK1_9GAMM
MPDDPKAEARDDLDADAVHAREWRLQEGARAAHRQCDPPDGDARALRYRLIARALDREPQDSLPSNFAYAQAQRIAALVAERRRADARFIRRLRWAFALGYGGAIAVAALVFRDELSAWLAAPAVAGVLGSPWLLAGLGCAAIVSVLQVGAWRGMRR